MHCTVSTEVQCFPENLQNSTAEMIIVVLPSKCQSFCLFKNLCCEHIIEDIFLFALW